MSCVRCRAPDNLKLAGNWPKMAAMCGLKDYKKKPYTCSFQNIYPYYCGFYQSFLGFRPIWLAFSISCSSFWLVDTYFWSYFSWLAKSGCQNLKLARNTFPPFPSFWSPGAQLHSAQPFFDIKYNSNHQNTIHDFSSTINCFLPPVKNFKVKYFICYTFITVAKSKMYWQGVKSIALVLKKKVSPEAILFTPMQYILLFAAVIKCIAHPTFNHIMYNIFDFLLVAAKKNVLGLHPCTFRSSLEPVKSQKC